MLVWKNVDCLIFRPPRYRSGHARGSGNPGRERRRSPDPALEHRSVGTTGEENTTENTDHTEKEKCQFPLNFIPCNPCDLWLFGLNAIAKTQQALHDRLME